MWCHFILNMVQWTITLLLYWAVTNKLWLLEIYCESEFFVRNLRARGQLRWGVTWWWWVFLLNWLTGPTNSYLPPSPLPRPGYWFPLAFYFPFSPERDTAASYSFLSPNTNIAKSSSQISDGDGVKLHLLWLAVASGKLRYKRTPFVCLSSPIVDTVYKGKGRFCCRILFHFK